MVTEKTDFWEEAGFWILGKTKTDPTPNPKLQTPCFKPLDK